MAKSKALYCVSGRLGVTNGFQANNTDSVNEDNDGEIPDSTYNWTIDLTHLLSEQFGRQLSQMATYRVKGIHMSLRNVNDVADNDSALAIGGIIRWYSPTKHRIDALQMARQWKRQVGESSTSTSDPFAHWNNDNGYKGMRFNWNADNQLDTEETPDGTTVMAGSDMSMFEIFEHYNDVIGGLPGEAGRPVSGEGEALWSTRLAQTGYDSLYWNTAYTNRTQTSTGNEWHEPSFQTFDFQTGDSNHLPVLGGLMRVIAVHSNTDAPGIVEDDYYIQCSILVEGWEGF